MGLWKQFPNLLLAVVMRGVSREDLRRAMLAGGFHAGPELHGGFGPVAALCHHHEADVVGFGLGVGGQYAALSGEEEHTSCVRLAGQVRKASRRSRLRPKDKSKAARNIMPAMMMGDRLMASLYGCQS